MLLIGFYLYGWQHNLIIYTYKPIWLFLMIKVLATWAKFLQPSGYCTVINLYLHFLCNKCFLVDSMVLCFISVDLAVSFWIMLHIHLCDFQISHGVEQSATCQHTNYHNTTNLPTAWTALITCYMCRKLGLVQILQNFWLAQVISAVTFFFSPLIFICWNTFPQINSFKI